MKSFKWLLMTFICLITVTVFGSTTELKQEQKSTIKKEVFVKTDLIVEKVQTVSIQSCAENYFYDCN